MRQTTMSQRYQNDDGKEYGVMVKNMVTAERTLSSFSRSSEPTIAERHWSDIARFLSGFSWRWVIVLTVASIPGKSAPRYSTRTLIDTLYPEFIKRLGIE